MNLTREQVDHIEHLKEAWRPIVHSMVLADAIGDDKRLIDIVNTIIRSRENLAGFAGAATLIIAEMFYELHPQVDRKGFAKAYYDWWYTRQDEQL